MRPSNQLKFVQDSDGILTLLPTTSLSEKQGVLFDNPTSLVDIRDTFKAWRYVVKERSYLPITPLNSLHRHLRVNLDKTHFVANLYSMKGIRLPNFKTVRLIV
ncbi:hypothetical protein TNCV_23861 [Trichonephila clavipes]|nr:hypothetical protein TNCV_23861 [Trichonephila clavipes]